MSHDHGNSAVSKCINQADCIPHHVQKSERIRIGIVGTVPPCGSAIATLVGRNHVIACGRQREHDFTPAIGKLWKTMHQENCRLTGFFETRLQNMYAKAVDVWDGPRSDTCRNRAVAVW